MALDVPRYRSSPSRDNPPRIDENTRTGSSLVYGSPVDGFKVHEQVVANDRAFTSGFVQPRDCRISTFIEPQGTEGVPWPDPWLSLNPLSETGGSTTEYVAERMLHPECDRLFRRKTDAHDTGREPVAAAGTPCSSPLDPAPGAGARHPEPAS